MQSKYFTSFWRPTKYVLLVLLPGNGLTNGVLQNRHVMLFVAHLRDGPRREFERGGIVRLLGQSAFYADIADVITRVNPYGEPHA